MSTDQEEKDGRLADIGKPAAAGAATWQRRDPVAIDPVQYKAWCDDKLAAMMAEPVGVQQAAAVGVAGPSTALPYGDAIQASFGLHDIRGVQAHVGGPAADAAQQMGAHAYATGNSVAFAAQPDLHLAAHEAAHVVQQRGGVQLKGGVGQVGDAYEQHADQVADAVVRGESAQELLGPFVTGSQAGGHERGGPVQKFSAREHQQMGNDGAGTAWVMLDDDYSIPFGDVTALAGDHFSSIEQMRAFAKRTEGGPNSRLEIEWARKWMLGANVTWVDSDPKYQEARKAQESRYYKLAAGNAPNYAGNPSHFPNPTDGDTERSTADKALDYETRPDDQSDGTKGSEWTLALGGVGSIASYRLNHLKAITAAAKAGAGRQPIADALATEAFACHYLTDSFAGGHVRTARRSIKEYWDSKTPMFATNLVGYMSEQIARYLREHQADVKLKVEMPFIDVPRVPSFNVYPDADHFSETTVTDAAAKKVNDAFRARAYFSLGDVISGAVHDRDNSKGVTAHVHGKKEVLRGDGHAYDKAGAGDPENNTAKLATDAVALSVSDIYKAKQLGASMKPPEVVAQLFDAKQRLFPAEEFIPTLTQEDLHDTRNEEIPWKAGSVAELLTDPAMHNAIAAYLSAQGSEIKALKASFPGPEGDALDSVAGRLKGDPAAILLQIIHWTPGHASDPVARRQQANEYVSSAKKVNGGFASLTGAQRLSLMKDIIEGSTVTTVSSIDESRDTLWELLNGMSPREAMHVIPAVPWQKLSDLLGETFRTKFPEDRFGQ